MANIGVIFSLDEIKMITNYFSSKQKKNGSTKEPKDADKEPAPPPAKKKKNENEKDTKRKLLTGYTPLVVKETIESWAKAKSKESGEWRVFEKLKMRYTLITKDWS